MHAGFSCLQVFRDLAHPNGRSRKPALHVAAIASRGVEPIPQPITQRIVINVLPSASVNGSTSVINVLPSAEASVLDTSVSNVINGSGRNQTLSPSMVLNKALSAVPSFMPSTAPTIVPSSMPTAANFSTQDPSPYWDLLTAPPLSPSPSSARIRTRPLSPSLNARNQTGSPVKQLKKQLEDLKKQLEDAKKAQAAAEEQARKVLPLKKKAIIRQSPSKSSLVLQLELRSKYGALLFNIHRNEHKLQNPAAQVRNSSRGETFGDPTKRCIGPRT